MPISVPFLEQTRQIPQTDEENWGDELTDYLVDLAELDALIEFAADVLYPKRTSASSTLASGTTLTPSAPVHLLTGSGGAITLSASTAIADGAADGVELLLAGDHAANFVTLLDAANTLLNGPCQLRQHEFLYLRWSAAQSAWVEVARSA